MPASEDQLMARLGDLGIATTTQRHPPVFTVEEAKALRGTLPGHHIKNLFLKDKKGQLWLVVAEEDRAIDLKDLRRRIGAASSLSFAKAEILMEVLGVEPGSVSPFAVINDEQRRVRVVLDAAIAAAGGTVNAHPLINTATTAIDVAGLLSFLSQTGHEPEIVVLGSAFQVGEPD